MNDDAMIERMSEAAHNAWLAEKRRRGVTSWPNERGVEQMVPYDQLDEDVKEFDRIVVRAIAAALPGSGGHIPCRVYWGSHGCKKRSGHQSAVHVCTCGERPPDGAMLFGEDV